MISEPAGRTQNTAFDPSEAARLMPRIPNWAYGIGGLLVLLLIWWFLTEVLPAEHSFARRFSP